MGDSPTVMIQCVGSRDEARPWCSRVCCPQAVKNALWAKRLSPEARLYVLHRDVRTFGPADPFYHEARAAGVAFVRFGAERKPAVSANADGITVKVFDCDLGEEISIDARRLVLSAGIEPRGQAGALAELLGVALDRDGFFLEADADLKPMDFGREGVYLCGLAHGPKPVGETVCQALAAAGRAAAFLSGGRPQTRSGARDD